MQRYDSIGLLMKPPSYQLDFLAQLRCRGKFPNIFWVIVLKVSLGLQKLTLFNATLSPIFGTRGFPLQLRAAALSQHPSGRAQKAKKQEQRLRLVGGNYSSITDGETLMHILTAPEPVNLKVGKMLCASWEAAKNLKQQSLSPVSNG